MSRVIGTAIVWLVSGVTLAGSLDIVKSVEPVCDPEAKGPPRLVVHVLDHEGNPMEGIVVEAVDSRGQLKRGGKTDRQGVARIEFDTEVRGEIRVKAAFTGFSTSVAERVHVRKGCLTGLTLPMQMEVPRNPLTNGDGRNPVGSAAR